MAQLRSASRISHAMVKAGNDPIYSRFRNRHTCAISNGKRLQAICFTAKGNSCNFVDPIQAKHFQLPVRTKSADEVLAAIPTTRNSRPIMSWWKRKTIEKLSPLEG